MQAIFAFSVVSVYRRCSRLSKPLSAVRSSAFALGASPPTEPTEGEIPLEEEGDETAVFTLSEEKYLGTGLAVRKPLMVIVWLVLMRYAMDKRAPVFSWLHMVDELDQLRDLRELFHLGFGRPACKESPVTHPRQWSCRKLKHVFLHVLKKAKESFAFLHPSFSWTKRRRARGERDRIFCIVPEELPSAVRTLETFMHSSPLFPALVAEYKWVHRPVLLAPRDRGEKGKSVLSQGGRWRDGHRFKRYPIFPRREHQHAPKKTQEREEKDNIPAFETHDEFFFFANEEGKEHKELITSPTTHVQTFGGQLP
eukprot:CAMPEP_0113889442 /NCGR_PEP_ID=MMETSP0780_2-20120614/13492_1 /TAXON_ID=652834 /ORGANISM="Palpitomonas bilix" /LENGTH=309 /DNA_ID=CAMNT_0000878527 /DNA_START=674 /DNA_END=1603 /DNA_ORIENTATION=+ /assembly_acc=CAM_ASM_000599